MTARRSGSEWRPGTATLTASGGMRGMFPDLEMGFGVGSTRGLGDGTLNQGTIGSPAALAAQASGDVTGARRGGTALARWTC